MKLRVVAEEQATRYAVDRNGGWWMSWCFKTWVPAFRYNRVPPRLARLAHNQENKP